MAQFHGWHTICATYAQNAADAVIAKDLKQHLVSYTFRPCIATVEQNRAHYCLVDAAICTARPKIGSQVRECGTNKINAASDFIRVLAVCYEHRVEVLEFVNIPQGHTIKQGGTTLLTRAECWHHLDLRGVNAHTYCGGVAVNRFKQALHLSVAAARDQDIVGIGEVRHSDVGTKRNPWVIL